MYNWKSKAGRNLAILLVLSVLSSLLAGSSALAQEPEPTTLDPDDLRLGPSSVTGVASPAYYVGVEWVADFTTCPANDLPNCTEPECMRLYNNVAADGAWAGRFHYGNWSAFERDFMRSAVGGVENNYVDNVDLALFCSHGSSAWDSYFGRNLSSLYFGSPHPGCHLTPGEAVNSYGDRNLEWLGFYACSVLNDASRPYWAATMNGVHLILGMKTDMYCSSQIGGRWADYMLGFKMWFPFAGWIWIRSPQKVAHAWFEAVDDTQPGGVCARVLAERPAHFDDYLHGKGTVHSDHPIDNIYHWRTHCSCTPPALQLAPEVLAQIETLPVYEVKDREVNEEYVLEIASAFEMSGTVHTDGEYYYMLNTTGVETYTLQVDRTSGGYRYQNTSELWASPVETPTLPLADEALRLGDEFFTELGAELPGAAHRTGEVLYAVEEEVEAQKLAPGVGIFQEQILSRMPLNVSLSYGRVISPVVGLRTALGKLEPTQMALSVVGPGARTKMYLGEEEILGVQGGSRDIQTTGAEVTIMDADKAWDLYLADPTIALATIPRAYDVVSKTAETLGYYEQMYAQGQTELVPSWVFSATFSAAGEILAEGVPLYVPAAADYLPPEVEIEAPTAGAEFEAGELVTFSGSVVQQGRAPFTYEWFSSHDGFLGSGSTITVPLTAAIAKGDLVSHTISLQVTDANGQQGADSVMVAVKAAVYLPIIIRNW